MPSILDIQQQLTPVFDAYGVHSAVLFGSFAKGTAGDASDVDLLVDSGLRGLRFVGLIEAVHEALSLPVDLLDVTHIEAGSPIDKEIAATGIRIYEE